MYYRAGTGGRRCIDTVCALIRRQHFSVRNDVMAAMPYQKYDSVYLKNNPAKFHNYPIWNNGALGFFWRGYLHQEEENNNNSRGMRSVTNLRMQHYKSQKA